MTRPACVVNLAELPAEKRPKATSTPGVGAMVNMPSMATGLTQMGVSVRSVAPGFAGTNRHFHTVEEEWVYVLSGHGSVRIGPLTLAVRPGHFVGFPPGPAPHHFVADRNETLIILEGGERRPVEDTCWYPDSRIMFRSRALVKEYEEPPPEAGDPSQVIHADDVAAESYQHDLDSAVRRKMRALHGPVGLQRQAVYVAQVEAGGRSTVFHTHDRTDEWVFILSGRGIARVGNDRFEIGPQDFLGHPAGGPAHMMEAVETLTYLVGGQIDAQDVTTYPEAGIRRVGDEVQPLQKKS